MQYGYVRVSKKDQLVERQVTGIKSYYPNIEDNNIYIEYDSGMNNQRTEYLKLLEILSEGDELIIHELDRLGRDKEYLKKQLIYFSEKKIILRVLELPTTLHSFSQETLWVGDMINNIILEVYISLAEREREKLSIRTKQGLQAARERGELIGRPPLNQKSVDLAIKLYNQGYEIKEICQMVKISRKTLYKYIGEYTCNLFLEGKTDEEIVSDTNLKENYIKKRRKKFRAK